MHLIITDAWLAKSRPIHLSGRQLVSIAAALLVSMVILSATLYHWVFLKGAREGWPIIGSLVKFVVRDDFEQKDRFLRENIDVIAQRLGEMQVKLIQLESLGERVSGLAGVNAGSNKSAPPPMPGGVNPPAKAGTPKPANEGKGGVFVPSQVHSLTDLQRVVESLEVNANQRLDFLTAIESRLFDEKMKLMLLPTQHPIVGIGAGSGYGWRIDPFNGKPALHTGLDFQANVGTPIVAAAGGVVVVQEVHPAYGNMIEVDHGNQLITRYAHASRVLVKKGDLIKRGQKIAEVGNSGRSTGPHLHFEVLINGVTQDPQKFLSSVRQPLGAGNALNLPRQTNATSPLAARTKRRNKIDPATTANA
jgi:murein DD-endopeptidase MepM/ murein hydrolase activator NlpD